MHCISRKIIINEKNVCRKITHLGCGNTNDYENAEQASLRENVALSFTY